MAAAAASRITDLPALHHYWGYPSPERSQPQPSRGQRKGILTMAVLVKLAVVFLAFLAALTLMLTAAIVAAVVLVTLASHYEERYRTLTRPAPGPWTWLARRLLAMPEPRQARRPRPGRQEELPRLERTLGPRSR
jgi:hypothetical protein